MCSSHWSIGIHDTCGELGCFFKRSDPGHFVKHICSRQVKTKHWQKNNNDSQLSKARLNTKLAAIDPFYSGPLKYKNQVLIYLYMGGVNHHFYLVARSPLYIVVVGFETQFKPSLKFSRARDISENGINCQLWISREQDTAIFNSLKNSRVWMKLRTTVSTCTIFLQCSIVEYEYTEKWTFLVLECLFFLFNCQFLSCLVIYIYTSRSLFFNNILWIFYCQPTACQLMTTEGTLCWFGQKRDASAAQYWPAAVYTL